MKSLTRRLAALEARRARARKGAWVEGDFFFNFRRPDMDEWNLHIALAAQQQRLDPLHRSVRMLPFDNDYAACVCRQPHPPLAPEDWPYDLDDFRRFNEFLAANRVP